MNKLKLSLVIVLACLLLTPMITLAANQTTEDKTMPKSELLDYMKERVVQVGVSTTVHYRNWKWKKETTYNDDGKKETNWKAIKGEWKKEKRAFHCSGCVFYSGEKKPLHNDTQEKVYGHSLIFTNYHCVLPLLKIADEYFGSSKFDTVKVYDKDQLKKVREHGNWIKPKEGERAKGEKYITINDRRPIIKHRKDQNYTIHAKVETYDAKLDIGILRLDNVYPLPEADFSKNEPKVGQEIWIGGAPLAIPFSYDKGRVNQLGLDLFESDSMNIGWMDQVKLDVAGAPGSSGSAIFNEKGDVEAILHGSFVYGRWGSIQGGQLALNAQNVKEWLRWNGYSYALED